MRNLRIASASDQILGTSRFGATHAEPNPSRVYSRRDHNKARGVLISRFPNAAIDLADCQIALLFLVIA